MNDSKLNITQKENYEICQFNNGRGNALNLELIQSLNKYILAFPEREAKGVILSGQENIFSVGLDIKELIAQEIEETRVFFESFFELVMNMVKAPYPIVSAINGHSPAGGCVLAIASDFRVMADDDRFQIGLNELPVGIMATPSIFHLYRFWIGSRNAYQYLLTGKQMSPLEAKKVGLVDEIVSQEEVLEIAEMKMQEYLSFDYKTWCGMKRNLRTKLIQTMEEDRSNGHVATIDHFENNNGKEILTQKVMELMSKRKQ
ncbi:enoyl-CoA hydratase/isomerase family protein [Portibacter marinus]|uniref:enoyl-CoA hydratase/isomerase family protein n=1 Tax=Portibacter marinus TaxID=2898660 RepID=UPI001F3E7723|nr:enoyl-CoA hydratase/isomerase family protein [Portibacter marinus]